MNRSAKWITGVVIAIPLMLWVAYENRAQIALAAIGKFMEWRHTFVRSMSVSEIRSSV